VAGPAAATVASYAPGSGLAIQGTDAADPVFVSVTESQSSFVVHDFGPTAATIEPGSGCSRAERSFVGSGGASRPVVECPISQPPGASDRNITAQLGGGDDFYGGASFASAGQAVVNAYDGGSGNDRIIGGIGIETIRGGDGDDLLTGAGGGDRLEGGTGNDAFNPGPGTNIVLGEGGDDRLEESGSANFGVPVDTSGADSFTGGAGRDRVGYQSRTAAVTVAADGPDGQAGENDSIASDVEEIVGGSAADNLSLTLRSTLPGLVDGGAGADLLSAVARIAVTLRGGLGRDRFVGSSAPETLEARDGETDEIACGGGSDSLDADLRDKPPPDCEKVTQGAVEESANVRIRTRRAALDDACRAAVRLACPRSVSGGCEGTLRMRGRRRGRAVRYAIDAGRSEVVRARVSGADARRISRRRRSLRAVSVERGELGDKTTVAPIRVSR
jgi:hypothetical protein